MSAPYVNLAYASVIRLVQHTSCKKWDPESGNIIYCLMKAAQVVFYVLVCFICKLHCELFVS